ncbi:hypothetical protein Emed_001376 [Eimeria media]
MAALGNGVFQANAQSLAGDSDVRVASTFKSLGIEFGGVAQRASNKGLQPGFHRRLFAVSVASLVLVFVLLRCFQYVSFVPKVAAGNRSLASGGSGEEFCPNWPGNEEIEEGSGDTEEDEEGVSGAPSLPAAAGVAQLPSVQESGAGSFQESAKNGWESKGMPPQWIGRAAGLLHAIKTLSSTYMALFPSLEPSQAVKLCARLTLMAAIELASLAYAPSALQSMRLEAADAFASMVERVQSNDATRKAARKVRQTKRLGKLKLLLRTITATPPTNVVFQDYKTTMTSWLNTATYTITQVSAHLELLSPQQPEQRTADPQLVDQVMSLLRAIYATRRKQMMRIKPLREWLSACQVEVRAPLIRTGPMPQKASSSLEHQLVLPVDEVTNAILAAGGSPVPSGVPTSYTKDSSPQHHPVVSSPFDTGGADDLSHGTQYYSPWPPAGHLTVPPPAELEPLQLPHHHSDPAQASTPPQPQAQVQALQPDLLSALHPPDAAGGPSHWEELGARPRQQLAPVAQSRAHELGWGYRQMPQERLLRVRELLELMRTAATACGTLLSSLSPRHAALLSMRLSSLVAVQISLLAYIPPDLQPLREAVGAAYRHLLESVLTTEPTRSAAANEGLTERIQCVQVALERLSGAPPDIQASPDEYRRRISNHYRVCRYANLQVHSLLENLIPSQPPSSGAPVEPEAVIRAVARMIPAFKSHLLADTVMRSWFVSQASNLVYPLYTQEDLENASKRKCLSARNFVRRLQDLLVRAGVKPLDLEKLDPHYDGEPESSEINLSEPSSASSLSPAGQDSQQEQPAPPAHHSLLPPPAHDHPSSQPPSMPAFSSQPNAHPEPSPWSAAPTPPFGLHHSPWTWSSADQKLYQQQHGQASSDWPLYFSSAHSPEPTDGGVSGSWDEGQVEESSGAAAGDLGLRDLAQRVAEWGLPGAEDPEDQGSSGDLGLLDLAERVSKWDVSDTAKDEEDD